MEIMKVGQVYHIKVTAGFLMRSIALILVSIGLASGLISYRAIMEAAKATVENRAALAEVRRALDEVSANCGLEGFLK